jgi:hypothetical protein
MSIGNASANGPWISLRLRRLNEGQNNLRFCGYHPDRDIKGVVPVVVVSPKIGTRGGYKKEYLLSLEIALMG